MTIKPIFKSDAYEAIHSSASGMFRIGAIDQATMRHFDERCLTGQEDEAEPADDASTIKLGVKDSELPVSALSNPREPSKAMRERVASYLARIGEHRDRALPDPCTVQGSG